VDYFSETDAQVKPKDIDIASDDFSTDAGGASEMDAGSVIGSSCDQSSCIIADEHGLFEVPEAGECDDECVELSEDEEETCCKEMRAAPQAPAHQSLCYPVMMGFAPQMVAVPMPMQTMMAVTPMTFAPCVNGSAQPEGSGKENVQRLEQKARTLSDYAAQLKAAAKKTKAVAKAKPRRGEVIHWPTKDAVRKASEDSIESVETRVSVEPQQQQQQQQQCKVMVSTDDRTTLMLQNLPSNYTRDALCKLLDSAGARGHYNFVYLPKDFKTMAGFGYAFVNFVHNCHAVNIMEKLQGFIDWQMPSSKVLTIVWSNPHQGLHAHVERYRDSPVMHEEVSDEFKPMLLENGARVDFPPPTKRLKPPRVRKASGLEQGTS
jgi:hypothetical protein